MTLNEEVIQALKLYEDKIPVDVKDYICKRHQTTVEEIHRIAQEYSQEQYHENKPQPLSSSSHDVYRFIKDWG